MATLFLRNATNYTVSLVIEPWADSGTLEPGESITFEYEEPAKLEFEYLDKEIFVAIITDDLKYTLNNDPRHFYTGTVDS